MFINHIYTTTTDNNEASSYTAPKSKKSLGAKNSIKQMCLRLHFELFVVFYRSKRNQQTLSPSFVFGTAFM